jgi:hypothetical protein
VSDPIRDEESLSAELSALRSALRELRAPDDELVLRGAASARRAAASARRAAADPRPTAPRQTIVAAARARASRVRRPLAVAAAAAAVVAVWAVAMHVERGQRAERAESAEHAAASRADQPLMAVPPAPEPPSARAAFRPISFPRGLSSTESYSVVRVRLELATSAPGAGAPSAAIEADLLVGEDGLARAIRFDSADTLPVYAASSATSGERR